MTKNQSIAGLGSIRCMGSIPGLLFAGIFELPSGFWFFQPEFTVSPTIMGVENHAKYKETHIRATHFPLNHDYGRKGIRVFMVWKQKLGVYNLWCSCSFLYWNIPISGPVEGFENTPFLTKWLNRFSFSLRTFVWKIFSFRFETGLGDRSFPKAVKQ